MATVVMIMVLFGVNGASRVRDVYWDTLAAREKEVPRTLLVKEFDQVNIICPVLKPGTSEGEQHIIYSVEKEEFDNCRVTSPKPKIVAICNRPQTVVYFTITFRSSSFHLKICQFVIYPIEPKS